MVLNYINYCFFILPLIIFIVCMIRKISLSDLLSGISSIFRMELFRLLIFCVPSNVISFLSVRKVPSNLQPLSNYARISSYTHRILGLNPGSYTLHGTNTWLIIDKEEHILIDTGEEGTAKEYVKFLFDEVFPITSTKRLSKIVLTHGHHDHQGGLKAILNELSLRTMFPLPTVYKRNVTNGKFPVKGYSPVRHLTDGELIPVGNEIHLKVMYTPGHTDDSICLIFNEDHAIISGDSILGCGTTVFDDLHAYMQSLYSLKDTIAESATTPYPILHIYPGHGPIIQRTAMQKIDEYITHRNTREDQILKLMPTHWITSWQLLPMIYGKLSWIVKISAQKNLSLHLEKLRKDGCIEYKWPDLWKKMADEVEKKLR